jgi:3-deoxy-D-manno-octulosonic-acid transferase
MLSLWLYRALIHAALPVVVPALLLRDKLAGKARPPFASRLWWRAPASPSGGLWIQAVSVGEVELARRLVAELEELAGERPSLLTSTTATGLALAARSLGDRLPVAPCPLDLPFAVRRVIAGVTPRALVLVETELWPEMMHQARCAKLPVAVVNARLSESSFASYLRFRSLLKPLLAPVSLVAARAESDAERFEALGVAAQNIRVCGNVKYDLSPSEEPLEWAERVRKLAGERPILVAGSTMEGEEEVVLDALDRLAAAGERPFLILAPRHPERFQQAAELLAARGVTTVRRSEMEAVPAADAFLIDTIGELGRAYALGRMAFVGGSLATTGGHNPLEPAAWAVPVLTGPTVHNFAEVYEEMAAAEAAVTVHDAVSLAAAIGRWLDRPEEGAVAGARAQQVVLDNRGATRKTVAALLELSPARKAV